MAPVASSPSRLPVSLDPLSPVHLPPVSQSSSSPFLSRPATPWPHVSSNPAVSSSAISPSSDTDYPHLSAASGRRRPNRSSSSSSPVAAPVLSEDPSPSLSSPPSPPDFQKSAVKPPALPSSSSPFASCVPDVAPFVPEGPISQFAPSCLADSLSEAQPSCVSLPDPECGRVASFSNHHPCPAGPSTCSSVSPSGLLHRPEAPENVVGSSFPQVPYSDKHESAGLW